MKRAILLAGALRHVLSIISILLICLLFSSGNFNFAAPKNDTGKDGWKKLPQIVKNIKAPKFPNRKFNVLDFGAIGDGKTNCKAAIDKAIEKCNKAGGGIVIIPKGIFLVNGPINLKSNVNLFTEEGTTVKFSTNPDDYLPVILTRWEGIECYNYSSLIYAREEKNIAITGKGVFDGQASSENWWPWKGSRQFGWEEGTPSQKDSIGRPKLVEMNTNKTPVEKRVFGKGYYMRPNFVQIYKCKNILIDGVTFLNSPMWVLHPLMSQNITIQNVSTIGEGPNTDGCDPESCKDLLIKNCYFKNGDDCIAIKSGRNNDGRRIGVPSENIVIQNCKMSDGHGGVTIGSEISGGCRNVYAENCEMNSPNLDRAIRIKSNTFRGGLIENVFVRNIKIGEVGEAVVRFEMNYEPQEGKNGGYLPVLRNVNISDVISKKSSKAFFLEGLPESRIKDISITNCKFDGVSDKSIVKDVENLATKNVYINGELYK